MVDYARLEKLVAYFKDLEPSMIDQVHGSYVDDCGCCVGAHIAHCLAGKSDYLDGIDDLYEAVYGSPPDHGWPAQAQATSGRLRKLNRRLMSHGSGSGDPFGTYPWDNPPYIVFWLLIDALRKEEETHG